MLLMPQLVKNKVRRCKSHLRFHYVILLKWATFTYYVFILQKNETYFLPLFLEDLWVEFFAYFGMCSNYEVHCHSILQQPSGLFQTHEVHVVVVVDLLVGMSHMLLISGSINSRMSILILPWIEFQTF